jgi:hypothetical protein
MIDVDECACGWIAWAPIVCELIVIGEIRSIEKRKSLSVWPFQTSIDLETDKDIILHNVLIDWSDHDDRNVEIEFYRRVDSVETRLDRHCLFRGSVRSGSDSTPGSIEHDPTCV